eukprot:PhF_6_TR32139/c0_g1_i4/m.47605
MSKSIYIGLCLVALLASVPQIHSAPAPKVCTIAANCSNHANAAVYTSVFGSNRCVCTCSGYWVGSNCSSCPKSAQGVNCDKCAVDYAPSGPASCRKCSVAEDCSGPNNAFSVSSNGTGCQCKCAYKWSGAKCDVCPAGYAGPSCSRCANSSLAFPACQYATPSYMKYVDRAVSILRYAPLGQNIYLQDHRFSFITLTDKSSTSVARTVCSSFFALVLKYNYPNIITNDTFIRIFGETYPHSDDYHRNVKAGNGFIEIKRMQDVNEGDVAALYFDPADPSENTGHMMYIHNYTLRDQPTEPFIPNSLQWEVTVSDSTATFHSKDTRNAPGGSPGGIGTGVTRVYTDLNGYFIGYTWGLSASTQYYPLASSRVWAVGRPTFLPDSVVQNPP